MLVDLCLQRRIGLLAFLSKFLATGKTRTFAGEPDADDGGDIDSLPFYLFTEYTPNHLLRNG